MTTMTMSAATARTSPAVGWIVFRTTPWAVLGPFSDFENAVRRAEAVGPRFRIAYGARERGVCDFVPVLEPDLTLAHRIGAALA